MRLELDRVVSGQIAPGHLVAVNQRHAGAELLKGRRHLVTDPHDVADRQPRRDRHIDHLERGNRRNDLVSPMDVRILDDLIPDAKGAVVA